MGIPKWLQIDPALPIPEHPEQVSDGLKGALLARFLGGEFKVWKTDEVYYDIPKPQRNFGRLFAFFIPVKGDDHYAAGEITMELTSSEWARIATELWQRSRTLKDCLFVSSSAVHNSNSHME